LEGKEEACLPRRNIPLKKRKKGAIPAGQKGLLKPGGETAHEIWGRGEISSSRKEERGG